MKKVIIGLFVLLALVVSAPQTHALTIKDLTSKVKSLQSEIASLQELLGANAISAVTTPKKVTAAALPACTAGTAPWIQVTSPNGGETYQAGSSVTVTWASCNFPTTANISLQLSGVSGGSNAQFVNTSVPNSGTATITLPTGVVLLGPITNGTVGGAPIGYGSFFTISLNGTYGGSPSSPTSINVSDNSDANFSIVNTAPALAFYSDPSTPSGSVNAGDTNKTLFVFKVTNPSSIAKTFYGPNILPVAPISPNMATGVKNIKLMNLSTNTQVGPTTATWGTPTPVPLFINTPSISIPANTSVSFAIVADIAPTMTGQITLSFTGCSTTGGFGTFPNGVPTGNSISVVSATPIVVPTLTTSAPVSITQTTANFKGTLLTTGGANTTSFGFNYGLTTAYGNNIVHTGAFAPGVFTTQTATFTTFTCGTTYHYRAYATNSAGTGYGNDVTFTTAACSAPAVLPVVVSQNNTYVTTVSPNTNNVKIGSFTILNPNTTESARVTSLVVGFTTRGTNLGNFASVVTSETSGSGSTPVAPQASNIFSVNFTLAPNASKIIDIFTTTGIASSGTIQTTFLPTALGVNSNTPMNPTTAVNGQVVTISTATLNQPTLLTAPSTPSQYIASGNGVTDATHADYNLSATGGSATVTELKFTVNGPQTVTSIRVGSVTAPVVGGVAWLQGLNIAVPNGSTGTNITAYVSYPMVGINGIASGATSQIALSYVKYSAGGTTITICSAGNCTQSMVAVPAPVMTLVGSLPTLAVIQPTARLTTGSAEAIDVTITANAQGNIQINSLPITIATYNATLGASLNTIIVLDSNNLIVATTNTAFATTGVVSRGAVTFTGGYIIQAGQSKTFKVFVPVTALTGTGSGSSGNGSTLTTFLTSGSSVFSWTDVAGGATTPMIGTNLMYAYTNISSVVWN